MPVTRIKNNVITDNTVAPAKLAVTSAMQTFLGNATSANLASAVTGTTGSGNLVFSGSPVLASPNLGTPISGNLINCTGLPISTGVSGLGTGVSTFLQTPTSANLAAAVTGETGTGGLVFDTNPTLIGATITGNLTVDTNTLFVDSVNDRVGIGTTEPSAKLHVLATTEQLRVGYDASNYLSTTVSSTGLVTLDAVGASAGFVFNDRVALGTTSTSQAILTIQNSNDLLYYLFRGINDNGNTNFLFTQNSAGDAVYNLYRNGTGVGSPEIQVHSNGVTFFNGGNVGIGTTTPNERLTVSGNVSVSGHFSAATKSFKIPHQSKEGYLQYGVVESNEHSVYVRGSTSDNVIHLPDHWLWLVDADSVTVTLTPVGKFQPLFVANYDNKTVTVGGVEGLYSYVVYGTRKDVAPLEIEVE